jgi:hypothetical protein
MLPVVMAYADFITKKEVAQALDLFYDRNARVLEYSLSSKSDNNLTTWAISLFSRYFY